MGSEMDGYLTGSVGRARIGDSDDGDPESADSSLLLRSFIVPGLTYPLWPLVTPDVAYDPPAFWVLLGIGFLAVPAVHAWKPLSSSALQNVMSILAAGVTLHLFLLAHLNGMQPFYGVGSALAVLATAIFIRSVPMMVAYSTFVVLLAVTLFAIEPDNAKLAYWGGMGPVLFLAYHRLQIQLARRHELEEVVQERTRQLTRANQLLTAEIEERKRLENELRVTHKMEAVGRLAGGVAHDFNNLLTTIGVYAELVLSGLSEESPLRNEVRQIQRANDQAASLTQQLLALGRRSHVQFELIDLNEVVSDAQAMLRHLLSPETDFVVRLDEEPQLVLGNIDQLQQILINLAINARDAMTGPGRFAIETARCPARELVAQNIASLPNSEAYVRLSVSDTGSGMAGEARDRAFDPFFTTKEPDQGAGLGLSIVHGIVSQADGYVRLDSEPGKGTRFDLFWPLGEQARVGDAGSSGAPAPGRAEEVLLVEDEQDLREALHRVLTSEGYHVTEVSSGEEAIELLDRRDSPFDLVITDVVMPHMSGFELADRVEASHPGSKILVISGHLSDRALAHLPSRIPFLAKPFTARQLCDKAREVLEGPELQEDPGPS